jgi:hypothetical protein
MKYARHEKGAGEQDRARSQVEQYARMWGSTGPILMLLARTPREGAQRFGQFAATWNADLDVKLAPLAIIADTPGVTGQGRMAA